MIPDPGDARPRMWSRPERLTRNRTGRHPHRVPDLRSPPTRTSARRTWPSTLSDAVATASFADRTRGPNMPSHFFRHGSSGPIIRMHDDRMRDDRMRDDRMHDPAAEARDSAAAPTPRAGRRRSRSVRPSDPSSGRSSCPGRRRPRRGRGSHPVVPEPHDHVEVGRMPFRPGREADVGDRGTVGRRVREPVHALIVGQLLRFAAGHRRCGRAARDPGRSSRARS